MNTTSTRKRIVSGIVGAAIAGAAAPALLFLGAGTAGAVADVEEGRGTTTVTHRAPGHVAIHVVPPVVSAPLVWGAYDSPIPIIAD